MPLRKEVMRIMNHANSQILHDNLINVYYSSFICAISRHHICRRRSLCEKSVIKNTNKQIGILRQKPIYDTYKLFNHAIKDF